MSYKNVSFLSLLEEIVDNRGKTCPTATNGIPLIATNCIKNENLYPTYANIRYVSNETYRSWFRGHPVPGDIIFVTKGSPGKTCWVPEPVNFCIAQDMVSIRVNEKLIYPKYLFALLRSKHVQKQIENMHVGTLIPHFKKGDFDKLNLCIDEDSEVQKRIGDIYFILSDKIELNFQMNKTLESIAQAIFKEWFVGEKNTSLSQYIDFNPKVSIPKGRLTKYVEMSDLPVSGFSIRTEVSRNYSNGSKFENNDTLLARITPCLENGKTGFVDFLETNEYACGSTEFIVMRAKERISPYYVYLVARDNNFREFAIKSMVGTSGRQRVQTDLLRSFLVPAIDIVKMDEFKNIVTPLFNRIKLNSDAILILSSMRDLLIPKLMTGKIRVA